MFRVNRLLHCTKGLITVFPAFPKLSPLVFNNIMAFANAARPKVFEKIEKDDVQQNLDKIMIDVASLSDQLRQEALEAILQKVFSGQLPPRLITHQKLSIQLKKHIILNFNAYFFRIVSSIDQFASYINGEDKKIKKTIAKQISDSFMVCFELLKKMEPKDAAPYEIQVLRTFANYNFSYLSKLVEPAKQKQCINKSRDSYRLTISKSGQYLKSLDDQAKKLESDVNPNETLQQKYRRQQKLQELEQQKFQVVQQYSELVLELFNLEDQLEDQRKEKEAKTKVQKVQKKVNKEKVKEKQQPQDLFQFNKEMIAIEPIFEKAVKNYSLVPNKTLKSQYLYQIKKILVEMKNEKKLRELAKSSKPKGEKQQEYDILHKEFSDDMDQLYTQILSELKKIEAQNLQPQELKQHIMLLISTQIHKFHIEDEKRGQSTLNEKGLGQQVQNLMNNIVDEAKRKRALVLVIHELKNSYGAKIDSYVEKVPRTYRTQKRNRKQQEKE